MAIKLFSQGAAQEVTGSRHFIQTNKSLIMVDCGAFQGRRKEAAKKNREWNLDVKTVNSIILTHAHYDHCGLLPVAIKNRYQGSIFSTPATRDLANIILLDSAKLQANDYAYIKKRAIENKENSAEEPLYGSQDVIETMKRFITINYNRPLAAASDIEFTFYDAGHILGSSSVFLKIMDEEKETTVLFSGDLGRQENPILKSPEIPPAPDYVVIESTYGDRLHEKKEEILTKLEEVINNTYKKGGKAIIPAFAVERTQDIIYYLHLLTIDKKIPEIPIFVDSPMAINATSIFRMHPECYDETMLEAFASQNKDPFGFNSLHYIENVEDSKKINQIKEPCIIISANGMCEGGRILHHLANNIGNAANTILIVGYMGENTLGRAIANKQKTVKIFGQPYALNAQVEEIRALSAHADYMEIFNYLKNIDLKKIKKVFLVHGEEMAQNTFKAFLLQNGVEAVEIVKYKEEYSL